MKRSNDQIAADMVAIVAGTYQGKIPDVLREAAIAFLMMEKTAFSAGCANGENSQHYAATAFKKLNQLGYGYRSGTADGWSFIQNNPAAVPSKMPDLADMKNLETVVVNLETVNEIAKAFCWGAELVADRLASAFLASDIILTVKEK